MSRRLTSLALPFVVTLWIVAESHAQSEDDSRKADARVRRALEYEVEGQSDFRNIMLRAALEVDSEHVSANWHSGRVRQSDKWLTIAGAQLHAREDENLSKYRELRAAASGDLKRQVHLARWCARFGLAERSKLHYAQLLHNPAADERTRQEALRILDLREIGGQLMGEEELKEYQRTAADMNQAFERWHPKLLNWGKAIEGKNNDKAEFSIQQMLALDDPSIVPVMESFVPVSGNRFGIQLVRSINRFNEHDATKALASFAALSPWVQVRHQAIGALKSRPVHDYVPVFLSWLNSPVKSRWRLYRDRLGNVRYECLALREGVRENQLLATERVGSGFGPVADWMATASVLVEAKDREWQLQIYNALVSAGNSPVFHALEQTTAVAIARDPVNWWSWWDEYNEIHAPPKRTQTASDRRFLRFYSSTSCFVAGTKVWTESGLTPIENIQAGDRVLSQDPDTGELAFKLVIGKTLRPPAPLTRICITGEEILTTKGHPLWVVSKGWRMAKFIETGQELHGIDGGTSVHKVELLKREKEAHNLVVADFATYFVGETGVLVHDNTYRKPTRALIPGFVKN